MPSAGRQSTPQRTTPIREWCLDVQMCRPQLRAGGPGAAELHAALKERAPDAFACAEPEPALWEKVVTMDDPDVWEALFEAIPPASWVRANAVGSLDPAFYNIPERHMAGLFDAGLPPESISEFYLAALRKDSPRLLGYATFPGLQACDRIITACGPACAPHLADLLRRKIARRPDALDRSLVAAVNGFDLKSTLACVLLGARLTRSGPAAPIRPSTTSHAGFVRRILSWECSAHSRVDFARLDLDLVTTLATPANGRFGRHPGLALADFIAM